MAEHQDHDTVAAAAETESPTELEESGQNIPQIQDGEPDVASSSGATQGMRALTLSREPETRAEFLQYSRVLTLDPNTANKNLKLCERERKATVTSELQSYPPHQLRFTKCHQVLSKQILNGRCYWEVEWSGEGVEVAVVSSDPEKRENRKGKHKVSGFGQNDTSWAFRCNSYNYRHNKVQSPIPDPLSPRVGVYLDRKAGILRFYSVVSETMTLIHRVEQITFTQPLYAGLFLFGEVGDTAELCDLCESDSDSDSDSDLK